MSKFHNNLQANSKVAQGLTAVIPLPVINKVLSVALFVCFVFVSITGIAAEISSSDYDAHYAGNGELYLVPNEPFTMVPIEDDISTVVVRPTLKITIDNSNPSLPSAIIEEIQYSDLPSLGAPNGNIIDGDFNQDGVLDSVVQSQTTMEHSVGVLSTTNSSLPILLGPFGILPSNLNFEITIADTNFDNLTDILIIDTDLNNNGVTFQSINPDLYDQSNDDSGSAIWFNPGGLDDDFDIVPHWNDPGRGRPGVLP